MKSSQQYHKQYNRQQGAALIMVLLVLAVISIIAVSISEKVLYNSQRLLNQQSYEQTYWYAVGAEQFITEILKADNKEKTTHLDQPWAMKDTVFPIDQGSLTGNIQDLNSCFNLNALAAGDIDNSTLPPAHKKFKALTKALNFDTYNGEQVRERVRDWIDKDSQGTGFQGIEFGFSTGQRHPYAAANDTLADISELYLFTELSREEYAVILPYLCALPNDKTLQLNINTIKTEHAALLQAFLSDQLTLEESQAVIEQRPQDGFKTLDEIWKLAQFKDKSISDADKSYLTLKSNYYQAEVEIRHKSIHRKYRGWYKIESDSVQIYARQYGAPH